MGLLIFLILIPTFFSLFLCALVGNAIPAVVVGGIFLVLLVLGIVAVVRDSSKIEDGGLLAVAFLIVIPSAVNTFLLLGGSGIYYLARYLGG